jgi:seryl-tRNA synthetase
LIPLLENHQQPDGTIRIPPALQPYLAGRSILGKPVF